MTVANFTGTEFVAEVVGLLKPEPLTAEQRQRALDLPLSDYTVYFEKLNMICEEAKEVFVRSGVSTMLLSGDLIVGIYTARGDMVTALCGTYIHAVTGTPNLKYIARRWVDDPTVGVNPGDFFFFNDPLYGSLHTYDAGIATPIFSGGKLIAWACAAVQSTEIGATDPGMALRSRSRYDEGMLVAPIKIGENFQLRTDLIEALGMATRTPQEFIIDLRARAVAADRVRLRVEEVAAKMGTAFLEDLFNRVILETERGVREKISRWNDGSYSHVMFLDTLGPGRDSLVKLGLTVHKKGDEVVLDFTNCSPEIDGPWNSMAHMTVAHCAIYLLQYPCNDLPPSAGVFAPHNFRFRSGSFLNCSRDAATGMCSPLQTIVISLVHTCYSKMMFGTPDDQPMVTAPMSGNSCGCIYSGVNQHGVRITDLMTTNLNTSGGGGKYNRDGANSFAFTHCPWGKAADAEDVENDTPLLHLWYRHLKNSAGFGRYRGGAATTMGMYVHHTPTLALASLARNSRFHVCTGLFGGYPAATTPGIVVKQVDAGAHMAAADLDLPHDPWTLLRERHLPGEYAVSHNVRALQQLQRGEIYVIYSGGGGGYGDVLERDPAAVIQDVKDQLISPTVAERVYGVVFDPETLVVDVAATEQRRADERRARLARGKPFADFQAAWSQRRPPAEALVGYGSWPDGMPPA